MAFQRPPYADVYNDFRRYFMDAPFNHPLQLGKLNEMRSAADSVLVPLHGPQSSPEQLQDYVQAYPDGARIITQHDPIGDDMRLYVKIKLNIPEPPLPPSQHQQFMYPQRYQYRSGSAHSVRLLLLLAVGLVFSGIMQTSDRAGLFSLFI